VIIVDNHSGDGSVTELRRLFPRVEVVEAEGKLGYGAGRTSALNDSSSKDERHTPP
jgi:GT2 family glycosyltransferase